ncbi:sugar nucleotide-binding protein [Nonomuraea sp. NPDC026600]|uniref:sugar nucleotide-binding protein n=1 Tax=Nonomuraea sp. NPDC026600 TaxID=3155363 RepID=UPI0033E20C49
MTYEPPIFVVGLGLIGAQVARHLRQTGHRVVGVARRPGSGADTLALDLSDSGDRASLAEAVREAAPRSVVLVHGPSDVTWCEREPEAAITVHEEVASLLADAGSPVVLVSTDNVFDGRRSRNRVTDPVAPHNAYGRAKLAAERRLLDHADEAVRHVVLRVSLVYGWSTGTHRLNFAELCLRALARGQPIEAPDDQYFTPIHNDDVTRVVAAVAAAPQTAPSVAHVAGQVHLTRADFARIACQVTGAQPGLVRAVPRAATIWASRPANSSLAASDLTMVPGLADYRPRTPEQGLGAMWASPDRGSHLSPGSRARLRSHNRPQPTFGVDAGGSHTRVLIRDGDGVQHSTVLDSLNPAGAGAHAAARRLREVLSLVRKAVGGVPVLGWLASATVSAETADEQVRLIQQAATEAGVRGTVMISNDAIPLLLAPPLLGSGSVVIVGTGSGFLAGNGDGGVMRAGGYEYLASDEASAFDMGLAALRAACRALDGRGRPTRLLPELEEQLGEPLPSAARRLAALAHPKGAVAALAPVVCRAWLDDDPVACGIIATAVDQLSSATAMLRNRAGCHDEASTVITGGVATGCPPFAQALSTALRSRCGDHPIEIRADAAISALALAEQAPQVFAKAEAFWTVRLPGSFTADGNDHGHD